MVETFDIIISVPMSYSKLCNQMYIYIYIYILYMATRSYDLDHTIPYGMICVVWYGMVRYGMVW